VRQGKGLRQPLGTRFRTASEDAPFEWAAAYGARTIGLEAAEIQARSRNDICSMFEAPLGAASGGHTWFRPLRFAA
jgi:hypothetical protein